MTEAKFPVKCCSGRGEREINTGKIEFFRTTSQRRQWQPTPVLLPGESQGQRACWAAVYGVAQSRTRLEHLAAAAGAGQPAP